MMTPPTSVLRSVTSVAGLAVLCLVVSGCLPADEQATSETSVPAPVGPSTLPVVPVALGEPDAAVAPEIQAATERLVAASPRAVSAPEVDRLAMSGDLRQAWVLVELLRFQEGPASEVLIDGLARLTGHRSAAESEAWIRYGELLLAWDVPPPPDHLDTKRALYAGVDPTWGAVFDEHAAVDWRRVTWSGTDTDDIMALDEPETVTVANGGDWLPDDDVVYGVVVDGQARAYPRRVLEAHEVINDDLGDRPVAVTYCGVCGVAQAFDRRTLHADGTRADTGRWRSSGLMASSTRLYLDGAGASLLDPVTGQAVSGPLAHDASALVPLPVRTSTWAAWRDAFPGTTVVSDDGGNGRVYPASSWLTDRMAPVALAEPAPDARLEPQQRVLGVVTPDGLPLAFPVASTERALAHGDPVRSDGVKVVHDAGSLVVVEVDTGRVLAPVDAPWVTWSTSWPDSELWVPR